MKLDADGKPRTQFYYKRDDFNFSVVNFPYLYSNILFSPAYCVFKYLASDSVYMSLFDIRSVFNSMQSTDKQVDITGVSTVSLLVFVSAIFRN
jgi:hypothetical protein